MPHPCPLAARTEWAVDVLVHKWVVTQVDNNDDFFPHFIEFVVSAVAEETGVTVAAAGATKATDTDYTGGVPKGSGGSTAGIVEVGGRRSEAPLKFDLGPQRGAPTAGSSSGGGRGGGGGGGKGGGAAAATAAGRGGDKPPAAKAAAASSKPAGGAAAVAAKAAAAAPSTAPLASPADLLRSLDAAKAAPPAPAVVEPAAGAAPPRAGGGLIREVASTAAEVADHVLEPGADGVLTLRFTFKAGGVDTANLRMAQLVLDVAADAVTLQAAHGALVGAAADGGVDGTGVTLRVALPHAVDPAAVTAKLSRKGVPAPTLTITLPK